MTNEREFNFQPADFKAVRDLLYQRTGINLSETKSNLVYSRLARRLRQLNLANFRQYLTYLAGNNDELEHFINALTTNHTAFFREPHHFEILADLAEKFRQKQQSMKIWCAAASTGEEPWSIAMVLVEAFGTWTPPIEIIATDIDSQVLRHAEAAIYDTSRLAGVSEARRKQFFQKGKSLHAGKARVVPALQRLVTYRKLNLLDSAWNLKGPFDIIFCRNVMIYFDKPTQIQLVSRMVTLLNPDGLYMAGHSESFVNAGRLLKLVAKSTYKPASGNQE